MPYVAFAGGVVLNLVRTVTDKEMQGDSGVGPVDILIMTGIVTGSGVHHVIPFVGFAGNGGKIISGGIVDGQMERIDLLAAVGVYVRMMVST